MKIHKIVSLFAVLMSSLTCQNGALPPPPTSGWSEQEITTRVEQVGVKKAMDDLIRESQGGSLFDCHQAAHTIGRLGFEVEKEAAFQSCNASCHSGCYHGAMEAFLNKNGTENLAANVDRICATFDTSFGLFQCYHGSGHGILAYYNYNLPDTLEECAKMNNDLGKSGCFGGAFMENVVAALGFGANPDVAHSTTWLNESDPYFPCNSIDQSPAVQRVCYAMQTSWMLHMYDYDFNRVKDVCLGAPSGVIETCFLGFGRDASGNTLRNPEKIRDICGLVENPTYYKRCIEGATHLIIDFWGADLQDQGVALCKILDERGKAACYGALAWRVSGLFNDKQKIDQYCSYFEEEYRHLCGGST